MLLSEKNIVILEDDLSCIFIYQDILDIRYKTTYYHRFSEFRDYLNNGGDVPDLFIVDLRLKDGQVLNHLFSREFEKIRKIPFIIVSAHEDIDTIRFCLKGGASDYLIKPFKKNELIVKIEKYLEERNISCHKNEMEVCHSEFFNELTKKEMSILDLFKISPNHTVSRIQLVEKIWGNINVHPKTLDVHLYNLRKKLDSKGISISSIESGKWELTYH